MQISVILSKLYFLATQMNQLAFIAGHVAETMKYYLISFLKLQHEVHGCCESLSDIYFLKTV
jgi:hypothetical protein